jgi:hypothetical protein
MTTAVGTQRPEPAYTSTMRTRAATVTRHCHAIHLASRPACAYGTRCQAAQTAPRTSPVPAVPRRRSTRSVREAVQPTSSASAAAR